LGGVGFPPGFFCPPPPTQRLRPRHESADGRQTVRCSSHCLVLGGSGYLGQAVSSELANAGAKLAFTYHLNEDAARRLVARLKSATAIRLDLGDPDAIGHGIAEAAAALDGLDALIDCAAVAAAMEPHGPGSRHAMQDVAVPDFDATYAVNVRAPFLACRQAAPFLEHCGGGNIVLCSSLDAVKPLPSPVHFAATQGALGAMTRAMAKELGCKNIRVNLVAIGLLDGGLSRLVGAEARAEYVRHCSLRRVAKPEEIAAMVCWLALRNTYVTGQTIVLDGNL
ncbi:MAG: SDR family oxidoreductase, partial [Pseudomonadota bacterium]